MNPPDSEQTYPGKSRGDSAARTERVDRPASDDEALIARMAAGDETALVAFYDRWSPRAYSVIYQLLESADDAEDVLEDTFWQIWRTAGSYDPRRSSPSTWILVIARSRSLDRLRSRARAREIPLELMPEAELQVQPSAEADTVLAERARLLAAALRELPREQRLAVELAYFRGLTQTQIAERTGEPLGTIKTRMRLGMQKLREQLAGPEAEP